MTAILRETVMSETGTNDNEPKILLLRRKKNTGNSKVKNNMEEKNV